jgi:hypothetical protein
MADTKMSELLHKRELTGKVMVTLGLLGVVGVAGLKLWSLVLPWLIDVAANTLTLGLLCGAIFALGYIVLNSRTRMLLTYGYASFVRFITKRFVDIDPIGILNTYVSRLEDRKKEMDDAKGKLSGQVKELAGVIQQNEQERQQSMARAEAAHKAMEKGGEQADEYRAQMGLASRQAKRLADSNKRLTQTLTQIEDLLRKVRKLSVGVDASIEDIKQNVDVVTREHRAIAQGFKAFQAARRSLGAGPEKELYEMTLDRLTSDYNEKMGEIEEFLEDSKKVISGVELDGMIAEDEAIAEIEAKKKGKVRVDDDASAPGVMTRVGDDAAEEAAPDSFASLYKGKGKR